MRELAGRVWPPGPWDHEVNEIDFWVGSERYPEGFMARASRHATMGHWRGYVDLPLGHPWENPGRFTEPPLSDVRCHGGITFIGKVRVIDGPDKVRIGFDCAHAGDTIPGLLPFLEPVEGVDENSPWLRQDYRGIGYVVEQLHLIITQADKAPKKPWSNIHATYRSQMDSFSFWDWLGCEGYARMSASEKAPTEGDRAMAVGAWLSHKENR